MTAHWDWATAVGLLGTALIVSAYAYVTAKAARADPFVLHGLNLVGAGLLVISLLVHTNLPSLLLEGIWAGVAVWGLTKAIMRREEGRDEL